MEIWIKDNNNDCTGIRIDGYKLWTMEICSDFLLIRNSWTPVVDSSNISSTLILEMLDRSWEIYSFELFFHSKILERMLWSFDSGVARFNLKYNWLWGKIAMSFIPFIQRCYMVDVDERSIFL